MNKDYISLTIQLTDKLFNQCVYLQASIKIKYYA